MTNLSLNIDKDLVTNTDSGQASMTGEIMVSGFQTGTIPTTIVSPIWQSSDESILAIDSFGHYVGKSSGQAFIKTSIAGLLFSKLIRVEILTPVLKSASVASKLSNVRSVSKEKFVLRKVVGTSHEPLPYASYQQRRIIKVNCLNETAQSVFLLFNPLTKPVFYTSNTFERAFLLKLGWINGGIAWYAKSAGQPVYRHYQKQTGQHYYSSNSQEKALLESQVWTAEGIAWYQ